MDINKIIPQLLEKINTLIEKVDKRDAVYAQILRERLKAEIPAEEIEKLEETIKTTHCAAPDSEQLSTIIADGVVAHVKEDVKEAVKETVRGMKIPLEHIHYYSKFGDAWHLVEKDFQRWFLVISVLCVLLFWGLGACLLTYRNSEEYWGKQYQDIVCSPYVTTSEVEALTSQLFYTGVLPKEYRSDPEGVKEKIRKNKLVIKSRKKQAAKNKGKYKNDPAIER